MFGSVYLTLILQTHRLLVVTCPFHFVNRWRLNLQRTLFSAYNIWPPSFPFNRWIAVSLPSGHHPRGSKKDCLLSEWSTSQMDEIPFICMRLNNGCMSTFLKRMFWGGNMHLNGLSG